MKVFNTVRQKKRQSGAILMETVLAIPLFMIFIGGVMWIGDLMVTRQQLVVADRYVAWNRGLRYDDKGAIDAGEVHRLFFADVDGAPSRYHQPSASDARIDKTFDWSHAASGQVRLKMKMPEWTRALFNAGQVFYESGVPLERVQMMFGRDKEDQRHVVLMRTKKKAEPQEVRNLYGKRDSSRVAQHWNDIAQEKWPYE